MKVIKPARVRERVQEHARAYARAGKPEAGAMAEIAARILAGVGILFPQTRGGKTLGMGSAEIGERVRWNASLLLGYLFTREEAPFVGLDFDQLTVGAWQGLGRWAGVLGDAPARDGFPMECVWLANRGLWAFAYQQRFYGKPPFAQVLREMERAYETENPGVVVEPGGMVETAMRMQSEPLDLGEATFKELIGRWRAARAADFPPQPGLPGCGPLDL